MIPLLDGLLDHVLDGRLVDERQHLLGLGLGGGQEPGAEAGGRDHGFLDRRGPSRVFYHPGATARRFPVAVRYTWHSSGESANA